jgi:hypothetical protein
MRSLPTYVIKYIKHSEVIFEHICVQTAWVGNNVILSAQLKSITVNKQRTSYFLNFYRCTVHFEDSLIITYQQMH